MYTFILGMGSNKVFVVIRRRGGDMVSAPDSGASGPVLCGHCVVFLGKTLL